MRARDSRLEGELVLGWPSTLRRGLLGGQLPAGQCPGTGRPEN